MNHGELLGAVERVRALVTSYGEIATECSLHELVALREACGTVEEFAGSVKRAIDRRLVTSERA